MLDLMRIIYCQLISLPILTHFTFLTITPLSVQQKVEGLYPQSSFKASLDILFRLI